MDELIENFSFLRHDVVKELDLPPFFD